ncbi:polysaccharide pyruvyl transferase [Calothrix sp. HK-06]|nr:polysaccharide pyruvyl transferase [Calothrix sp. HK-06]
MNILLMGYYGYRNVGDDLFVKQLINYFTEKKQVKNIFIICEENYYQTDSHKVSFFLSSKLSKIKKLLLILKSDCLIWGGGTLNINGKPDNLLRMQNIVKMTGKRFCFLGVGLEAIESGQAGTSAKIFQNANLLYLRDNNSYELARQELKPVNTYCLGGDLAFLDVNLYEPFVKKENKSKQIKNISFSGKFWWGDGRAEFYAKQLMPLIKEFNSVIHLLPAHGGEERNDNKFHKLMLQYLPKENCQIHSWNKPEDFVEILSQMDFHFGNRLHSIIIADILGVPNIGIDNYVSKNSKIKNYIDKTNMLSLNRMFDFMEPIDIDNIKKIFQEYQRPIEFILNESKTAFEGIEFLFKK